MTIRKTRISAAVAATRPPPRATFSVQRHDFEEFGDRASPVLNVGHYRMNAPTLEPHPHAGFSAISYLFEDSAGSLRNRDSLGHDFVITPGGIVWTQTGTGVIHDEFPAETGKEVHGLQIFINLCAANKALAPRVLRLEPNEIPVWRDDKGNQVRIPVGAFGGLNSPLRPAEPFHFLEATIVTEIALDVADGWNTVVYVVSGAIQVRADNETRLVKASEAVAVAEADDPVILNADQRSQVIILSGRASDDPVVRYGPFVMSSATQIEEALSRYQRGEMGALAALPP